MLKKEIVKGKKVRKCIDSLVTFCFVLISDHFPTNDVVRHVFACCEPTHLQYHSTLSTIFFYFICDCTKRWCYSNLINEEVLREEDKRGWC